MINIENEIRRCTAELTLLNSNQSTYDSQAEFNQILTRLDLDFAELADKSRGDHLKTSMNYLKLSLSEFIVNVRMTSNQKDVLQDTTTAIENLHRRLKYYSDASNTVNRNIDNIYIAFINNFAPGTYHAQQSGLYSRKVHVLTILKNVGIFLQRLLGIDSRVYKFLPGDAYAHFMTIIGNLTSIEPQ